MNHQDSKHSNSGRGVLDELESVKDALHAVDDDIAGLLTRPAEETTSATIPVLNDVVARADNSNSAAEASADHQLSRTNSYKVVTDADLSAERPIAEAEPEPSPATPPTETMATPSAEPVQASAGEVTFTAPSQPAGETIDEPLPQTEPQEENSIVPDFEQLEAELGVEPLPDAIELEASSDIEIRFDTSELDSAVANSPDAEGIDIDAELASFSLQDSTSLAMPEGQLFSNATIEVAPKESSSGSTLTRQQLTTLIEEVLDSHMVALQEALLEKLAPFAGDSADEQG